MVGCECSLSFSKSGDLTWRCAVGANTITRECRQLDEVFPDRFKGCSDLLPIRTIQRHASQPRRTRLVVVGSVQQQGLVVLLPCRLRTKNVASLFAADNRCALLDAVSTHTQT